MKRSKEEVTFFEKKVTKKTFAPLRARWDRTGPAPREAEQKFFARFFSKKRSSSGFTLLEVMAALVIAALATVVLLQAGFAGAAENRAAADYGDALSRAESRLASFGPLTPIQPEQLAGDDGGGFFWSVNITKLQTEGPLSLYDIALTESFGGRRLTLDTSRLAPTR